MPVISPLTGTLDAVGQASGAPIDPDVAAFLAATGITDPTQASAVTTLVTTLKTAGLWTKLHAIYPFVGGTAATHKFNLKDPRDADAAFRLSFFGTWTHSATGAKPNGAAGTYADTHWNTLANASTVSTSLGFYCRDQNQTAGVSIPYDMGSDDGTDHKKTSVIARFVDDHAYSGIGSDGPHEFGFANADGRGLYAGNRLSTTTSDIYRNGVLRASGSFAPVFADANVFLGCLSHGTANAYNSAKEHALSFMGDGLTVQNHADLYTAVQAYQTTLGRQVYMSIPVSTEFIVYGIFTASKQGKTGLTVTADVYRVTATAVTLEHAAVALGVGAWTAHVGGEVGDGLYGACVEPADDATAADYFAVFKTADGTVDNQWVYAYQRVGQENVGNLDAAVSTRATATALATAITTIDANTIAAVAAVSGGSGTVVVTPTAFEALIGGPIEVSGSPQAGVFVYLTTDAAGVNTPEATFTTSAFGLPTGVLNLNPGTHYVWCVLAGVNFPNPTPITVT